MYRRELIQRVGLTQKGIPMLTETLVKLRDLGATFQQVNCRMQPRRLGTPSASRLRVMWRTLIGLLQFWWNYRVEENRCENPASRPARPVPGDPTRN